MIQSLLDSCAESGHQCDEEIYQDLYYIHSEC
jgi:hypothetical protein